MTRQGGRRPAVVDIEKGSDMTKVRTTLNPGTVLEVGDAELLDLHRQGLLHSHEPLTEDSPIGEVKTKHVWKDAAAEDNASTELGAQDGDDEGDAPAKKKGAAK